MADKQQNPAAVIRGMEFDLIGSHADLKSCHYEMTKLNSSEQRHELEQKAQYIEDTIQRQTVDLNYQIRLYQEHLNEPAAKQFESIATSLNKIAISLESIINSEGHVRIWDGKA